MNGRGSGGFVPAHFHGRLDAGGEARQGRRGVLLLEVVVCVALAAVLMGLIYDLYRDGRILHDTCVRCQLGTREVDDFVARLRRDVRCAAGGAAEDGVLILEMPGLGSVVYRLAGDRIEREVPGQAGPERLDVLVRGVESLFFQRPGAPGRDDLVGWTLRLKRVNPQGRLDPMFDGVAAFRGGGR